MKKFIIYIISIILIITLASCSQGHSDGKSHLLFNKVEDFKTYVMTGSFDPKDYIDMSLIPYRTTMFNDTPRLIYNIDKEAFVDIRDLFPNQDDFLSNLMHVRVLKTDNLYFYEFENGISISFSYDVKQYSSNNVVDALNSRYKDYSEKPEYKYMSIKDVDKKTISKDKTEYFIENINDSSVAYKYYSYNGETSSVNFNASCNGFFFSIGISPGYTYKNLDELLTDPVNKPISVFFTEGEERTEAFQKLVNAIENREPISDE